MLRGSLSTGSLSVNKDIVFGTGLVNAVELEGKAKYPRIILDKSIKLTDEMRDFNNVSRDEDGEYYLDYLQYYAKRIELAENAQMEGDRAVDISVLISKKLDEMADSSNIEGIQEIQEKMHDLLHKKEEAWGKIASTNPAGKLHHFLERHKDMILLIPEVSTGLIEKRNWLIKYHNDFCTTCAMNDLILR